MPSPFPGMDPWLESPGLFPDVHGKLINGAQDCLNLQLKRGFYAAQNERIVVEAEDPPGRPVVPDVTVLGPKHPVVPVPARGAKMAVLVPDPPVVVKPAYWPLERRETFIEIRSKEKHRLLTVIEVLSPSNKRGPDRAAYLAKQREVLNTPDVSLIEIDLLRGGLPTVALPAEQQRGSLYRVLTTRATDREQRELYPFGLRDRLPRVAVPVTPEHGDVVLDLPSVFAEIYDKGRFEERAEYGGDPDPPLLPEDMAWARVLVGSSGHAGS